MMTDPALCLHRINRRKLLAVEEAHGVVLKMPHEHVTLYQLASEKNMESTTAFRTDFNQEAETHKEGPVAKKIEEQTAKLPSDTFLWLACGAIGGSAMLQLTGKKQASLFVGQWVAPVLLLGIYNKIVKVAGSDRQNAEPTA